MWLSSAPLASRTGNDFLRAGQAACNFGRKSPLANCERFPVNALCDYPFMLLEKSAKAEISEIFQRCNISPKVHFTTWDDYAIMSMVESGLGISILPQY